MAKPPLVFVNDSYRATSIPPQFVTSMPLAPSKLQMARAIRICAIHRKPKNGSRTLPLAPVPLRILVGEDNPAIRTVLKTMLESAGHRVTLAEDGCIVLRNMLQHETYDVAALDIHMSGLSGLDVIRAYKKRVSKDRHLSIVVLTAVATTQTRDECVEIGVNAYLTKPIDSARLITCISQFSRLSTTSTVQESPILSTRSPAICPYLRRNWWS